MTATSISTFEIQYPSRHLLYPKQNNDQLVTSEILHKLAQAAQMLLKLDKEVLLRLQKETVRNTGNPWPFPHTIFMSEQK